MGVAVPSMCIHTQHGCTKIEHDGRYNQVTEIKTVYRYIGNKTVIMTVAYVNGKFAGAIGKTTKR